MTRQLAACLAAAVFLSAPLTGQQIIEQVLVKVNGEILTKSELEARQIQTLRDDQQNIDQSRLKNDAEMQKLLREITPRILLDAVDEMLLVQRGRELGYRITDEQFKKFVENIKKENKIESDEQLAAALRTEGLTLETFRRNYERRGLIYQVQQQEVYRKIQITEQEAKEYYAKHPAEFTPQPTVTIREIFVNVPAQQREGGAAFSVADDEAAAAKARAARERALKGEPFDKLAAELSDAGSKANGGLIGPIVRNELSPALQRALQGMKPGEVSEPIRTQRGYQVIKLETATAPTPEPFEDVRDLIADKVVQQKGEAERVRLLDRLRAQAIIEWKNDELRKLYEQAIARPSGAAGEAGVR